MSFGILIRREGTARPLAAGPPAISTGPVSVSFGGVIALQDVTVTVQAREIFGLIGPNGAGKSTLVNVIAGSIRPPGAHIALLGRECGGVGPGARARRGLGRTCQDPALFDALTVKENLDLARRARRRRGNTRAADWLDRLPFDLELDRWFAVIARDAPYPVRKLTDVVRALTAAPDVLLMDEPAAGLAHEEREKLVAVLESARERLGCAILLIEHDVPMIFRVTDRLTVLSNGRQIATGRPDEISRHPEVIAAYLGVAP